MTFSISETVPRAVSNLCTDLKGKYANARWAFFASFPPKQLINAHEVNVKSWTTNPKQQNWKLNPLDPAL